MNSAPAEAPPTQNKPTALETLEKYRPGFRREPVSKLKVEASKDKPAGQKPAASPHTPLTRLHSHNKGFDIC
jgi:hypothetical protein